MSSYIYHTYRDLTVVQVEELIRYAHHNYSQKFVPKSMKFPCQVLSKVIYNGEVKSLSSPEWMQFDGYVSRPELKR